MGNRMTESDTCREFVTPKRVEAGWGAAESVIGEQHSFTNGRIIVAGGKVRRDKQRRADYLLYYRRVSSGRRLDPLAHEHVLELGDHLPRCYPGADQSCATPPGQFVSAGK